jgi:hypothetical protein
MGRGGEGERGLVMEDGLVGRVKSYPQISPLKNSRGFDDYTDY